LQAKLRRATSVLWWVTTREYVVLYFLIFWDKWKRFELVIAKEISGEGNGRV